MDAASFEPIVFVSIPVLSVYYGYMIPRTDISKGGVLLVRVRKTFAFFCVLLGYVRKGVQEDLLRIVANIRLFAGFALLFWGLLSFASDRYCDGNTSAYYSCTRPSTYYYYPWWSVLLVVAGVFGITLWHVSRRGRVV